MKLMRWLLAATGALAMMPVHAATKAAEQERMLYMWSETAELIVEGSIAAFETVDDPQARSAFFEATVRINTVQRGNPTSGTIRVRIEDPLQMAMWGDPADELGARGLWFLYRVQSPAGEVPFGHLIRYMSAHEIAADPAAADTLMRFVIEDTVDQAIGKDILKVLEPNPKGSRQTVDLRLHYDPDGRLKDLEILRNSGNALFDQHVFDQAASLHRLVRPSIALTDVDVRITRTQAAVEPRKARSRR
jgi:hypothetical protein